MHVNPPQAREVRKLAIKMHLHLTVILTASCGWLANKIKSKSPEHDEHLDFGDSHESHPARPR